MKKLLFAGLVMAAASMALAKIPAPVLTDEAKAKAAETAAKAAWTAKVDAYKLCKAQDKAAASYYMTAKAAGKETKPAGVVPPCVDPGPFAYVPPEAKPIEAAGAHSPAATATSPPSTKQPDAVVNPVRKKP